MDDSRLDSVGNRNNASIKGFKMTEQAKRIANLTLTMLDEQTSRKFSYEQLCACILLGEVNKSMLTSEAISPQELIDSAANELLKIMEQRP